ncbi:MAG: hypothetical protein IIC07_06300 [Proteobacteria bacterium]|nr:hypothetical protein [Pseudomonadota bacterium]MCH8347645.1 hypothetical protein [Pseudomonadota bacterium]
MRNLIIAWGLSLGLIAAGGAYLWSADMPEGKAGPEPVIKIVEEDPPVLSTGALPLDLTPPSETTEDCPGTC